jgi:type IV secretion system protein VirB10
MNRSFEIPVAEGAATQSPRQTLGEGLLPQDRGWPLFSQMASAQRRLTSVSVATLSLITGSLLIWYYASVMSGQHGKDTPKPGAVAHVGAAEMPLPPLGSVHPLAGVIEPEESRLPITAGPAPPPIPPGPLEPTGISPGGCCTDGSRSTASSVSERRMTGPPFAGSGAASPVVNGRSPSDADTAREEPVAAASDLSRLLTSSPPRAVWAQQSARTPFLLPAGAFIDCTLETAIDSSLPGMTTCVTATDTFGVDGRVVLLERGTKLIGETRGQLQQGRARIFVVWTQARTPTGVVVPLDSPTTDALGRSGLDGAVDYHFWQRFGAALLITTLDGAVQAGVQSTSGRGGTVIYSPGASTEVATEVLKGTANIAPTVAVPNGTRVQVLVARNIDFRGVYRLSRLGARK